MLRIHRNLNRNLALNRAI